MRPLSRAPNRCANLGARLQAPRTPHLNPRIPIRRRVGHDARALGGRLRRIIGSRVLHIGRDTPWGLVLRTHFFLGQDLPAMGMAPADVEALVPDDLGIGLLQHAYTEFTFLSRFLPGLFVGEHRDERPPVAPW